MRPCFSEYILVWNSTLSELCLRQVEFICLEKSPGVSFFPTCRLIDTSWLSRNPRTRRKSVCLTGRVDDSQIEFPSQFSACGKKQRLNNADAALVIIAKCYYEEIPQLGIRKAMVFKPMILFSAKTQLYCVSDSEFGAESKLPTGLSIMK